jgi:hypothetical protein
MLACPFSFLLLPAVLGLGVGYLSAARLADHRLRAAVRAAILMTICASPLLTRGPGPAQLILGLCLGYLGIRMVALSKRAGASRGIKAIVLDLVTPTGILQATTVEVRRPLLVTLTGWAGMGSCVVLLVLGNRWRLWQASALGHFLDDQLVLLEIAVGAAGMHGVIVGTAQLLGHSVVGLLDHPFRSTSLAEFWGRRWNRMVEVNLAAGFYRPLARSGRPTLGLLAAFLASGMLHVLAVLGAGPLRVVALPCAFVAWSLLSHGIAVLIEQKLGWNLPPSRRWTRAMAWTRTLILFVALSPGLIEPFAAVANVHGRSLVARQGQVDSPPLPRGCM